MIACDAFDNATLACGIYGARPEHCRTYDCRDDDPDEWEARSALRRRTPPQARADPRTGVTHTRANVIKRVETE